MQQLVGAWALTSDAEGCPGTSKGTGACVAYFKKEVTEHTCQTGEQKAFLSKRGMGYSAKLVCLGPLQQEAPAENTRQMFQF